MSGLKNITANIINGFSDKNRGGNPAGIVFDSDKLTRDEKLTIASKVGLSETAFVSKSLIADFKLDFFTPVKQIAHCGHATIAAFSYMKQTHILNKKESSKETIDGIRKIVFQADTAFMEQLAPKYKNAKDEINKILSSLRLKPADLIEAAEPAIVNTGNSFLIIGLKEIDKLKNLNPNLELIIEISQRHNLIGYYVFTKETMEKGPDASTRMFGPYYGIPEESATGMAAGPLACYLHDKLNIKKKEWKIEQGHFMKNPAPSLIKVDLLVKEGVINNVMVGGKGTWIKSLSIAF